MEEKKETVKGFYANKGANTIGLFAGGFPLELANEWEQDCKDRYNGCRWTKMWSDHLISKTIATQVVIAEPEQEKEEEIFTIGKKEKEEEKHG